MISVVIPYFRSGHLLGDAIESVLNQTEKDWELILVDNNASEDTREGAHRYARKYPNKIRLVHEPRQGNSFARNCGILVAQGEYVAFLDDDDIMYPDRLARQFRLLEGNQDAVMAYGCYDMVSHDNQEIVVKGKRDIRFPHFLGLPSFLRIKVRLDCIDPRPSTTLLRRKTALENGLYDTHFSPFFLEETDFHLRMFSTGDFVSTEEPVIRFRMPSTEFLRKKRDNNVFLYRLLQNQDYFYSKIYTRIENIGLMSDPSIHHALAVWKSRWLKEASFSFLGFKNGSRFARLLLERAIGENPSEYSNYKHYLRSFYSSRKRTTLYSDQQITEKEVPGNISDIFLSNLFSGNHLCEFCESLEN